MILKNIHHSCIFIVVLRYVAQGIQRLPMELVVLLLNGTVEFICNISIFVNNILI